MRLHRRSLKKGAFRGDFIAVLVTGVTTPALVFHTLVTTQLAAAQLPQVGGAILVRASRPPVAPLVPTATFPNSGNLGLPIAQLAFGDTGLPVAVVFFAVCTLLQHTLGGWLLAHGSDSGHRSWLRGIAIACLVGRPGWRLPLVAGDELGAKETCRV